MQERALSISKALAEEQQRKAAERTAHANVRTRTHALVYPSTHATSPPCNTTIAPCNATIAPCNATIAPSALESS